MDSEYEVDLVDLIRGLKDNLLAIILCSILMGAIFLLIANSLLNRYMKVLLQ